METDLLEAQILYSSIYQPKLSGYMLSVLSENDFRSYKPVYTAIKKMNDEGREITYVTLLASEPMTKTAMCHVVETDTFGETIVTDQKRFNERVDILKELSAKRQVSESFVNELDLNVLKERLEKIYKKGSSRWITGEDIKNLAYEIMTKKAQNSVVYQNNLLNKATGGMEKGQYIIVAGRPSVGKSAFMQYTGIKNSENGKKVLFISAEMTEEMIIRRILSTYRPETIPQTFHILIASDTATMESEILKRGRDFDLVMVDYIQLLTPKSRTKDRYEKVTAISSDLKGMANRFNIPFICASQFSRKAESGQPTLGDLRESGALEQDADIVISLWRDKTDDDLVSDQNTAKIRVDLLKNRNGYTFTNNESKEYALWFHKNKFTFSDIDYEHK